MKFVLPVAERARELWRWGKVSVGFVWEELISLFLNIILQMCNPKTPEAREKLIRDIARKCADNGVSGCIEACMSDLRARKVRRKMARKLGIKTAPEQDRHFYNASQAADVERMAAVKGMGSAYDREEFDDLEEL